MGTINRERIIALTGEAEKALLQLSQYVTIPASEILASSERLGNIKYQFIVAIEGCIDICQHIGSRLFAEVPEAYAQCFDVLRENKVISPETAEHMSELAKFRNLLVHLYWKVDDARVVGMLSQTPSITKYLREIAAFCKL